MTIGLVIGMFGPIAFVEHGKNVCRIEGIKSKIDAETIIKICGK